MNKSIVLHTFIVLMLISILLLVSNNISTVRVLKNVVIKVVFPISKAVNYPAESAGAIYSRLKNLLNSYEENIVLKNEIKLFKMRYMNIKYLKKENERLNRLLERENSPFGNLVTAEVLIQYPEYYFAEFIINKGKIHGIKKDFPVITMSESKWVLIGRVGEVFKDFSKVVLITSVDFRCAVDVYPAFLSSFSMEGLGSEGLDKKAKRRNKARKSGVKGSFRGVIKGDNKWMLKLDYISPDADIAEGDEVYTSGTGWIFPGGLYVGNIVSVKDMEFSTGKKGIVSGAYFPQNAKYVYVVKSRD